MGIVRAAAVRSRSASSTAFTPAGYEELAKKVDELSAQQIAIHDDVVQLQGYLEGLARVPAGTPGRALAGLAPAGRPAVPAPPVPVLRAAPHPVRALPFQTIRGLSAAAIPSR